MVLTPIFKLLHPRVCRLHAFVYIVPRRLKSGNDTNVVGGDNHVLRLLASSPDAHSFPHLGTSERLRPRGRDHRTARSQSEDNHVGVGGYGLRQKDWLESVKLLREVK